MRRIAEAAAFVGLALGAHAVALALHSGEDSGARSSGQDGAAQLSLEAANAQVTEMVARWDAPPETAETPSMTPPETPQARVTRPSSPVRPSFAAPAAPRGLALPETEAVPDIDLETAAPPPPAERETDAGPEQDPESAAPLRSGERPQMRPDGLRPPPEPRPEPERQAEPRQAPPQTSSPAQRAAGAGSGANAGDTDERRTSTLSPGQRQSLAQRYGGQIRATLERRKRYPGDARGASGTVRLRIVVARSGRLLGASIVSSSGHPSLDEAAVRAVRGARFPAAPDQLGDSQFSFTLPMNFSS